MTHEILEPLCHKKRKHHECMVALYQRDVKNMKNPCFPDVPQNAGGTPLAEKHEKVGVSPAFFSHKRLQRFCSTHVPLGFRAKTLKTTTLFHHFARKGRPFHQNLTLTKYNIIIKESQRRGTGIWAAIREKGSGARRPSRKEQHQQNT